MGSKSFSKLDRIWKNWLICRQSVHPIVSGSTWFSFLESLLFPGLEMAWTFYFRSIVYWSKFRQKRLATIMRCIIEPKWNTFQPNFQPIYIPNSLCISLSIYFHTFYLFLSFSLSLSLSYSSSLSPLSLSTAGLQFNKTGTDEWRKYDFIWIEWSSPMHPCKIGDQPYSDPSPNGECSLVKDCPYT